MARNSLSAVALPEAVVKVLQSVGQNIDMARKRRKMSQAVMAKNMFVTTKTLRRVLSGDPGVSIALYGSALYVLGLQEQLGGLAAPDSDAIGTWQANRDLPKRIRQSRDDVEKLDF